jgi:hypothetical protein
MRGPYCRAGSRRHDHPHEFTPCGENQVALKGAWAVRVRKGHRARLGRRARAEELFVSWTASVAKSALLPAQK